MDRDRNLLFGVFAVQLKLVTPQKLVEAAAIWATNQGRSIGDILIESGGLNDTGKNLIDGLIEHHVDMHNGDASLALRSFGGEKTVHETFSASIVIKDERVEFVSSGYKDCDEFDTLKRIDDDKNLSIEHPGKYTIKGEHGRGGIGKVLIAYDAHVGREVAIKELLPTVYKTEGNIAASPMHQIAETTSRFLREARITGKLEHPGIVPVYEIGKRNDGTIYYSMKLVRGKTLAEELKNKDLNQRLKLLPNFLDLCQTIAYAHSKGVIHRDIKPQNIMIGEFGETVLIDWGLAKVKGSKDFRANDLKNDIELMRSDSLGDTVVGRPIGTPAYMSPEQADGRIDEIDERSDIWSLGAVLYEILTGKTLFSGVNAYEIIGNILKGDIVNRGITYDKFAPPELKAICNKCLRHLATDRYPNALSLISDVASYQSGNRVSVFKYEFKYIIKKWISTHKTISILSAFLFFTIILTAGIMTASFFILRNINYSNIVTLSMAWSEKARNYMNNKQWIEANYSSAVSLNYDIKDNSNEDIYIRSKSYKDYLYSLSNVKIKPLWTCRISYPIFFGIEFTKDRDVVALYSPKDKKLKVINLEYGLLRGEANDFDTDGKALNRMCIDKEKIVSFNKNEVKLSTYYNLLFEVFNVNGLSVTSVAISPLDGTIITSGSDNVIRLWDPIAHDEIASMQGHNNQIKELAVSKDGKHLCSLDVRGEARIWDIKSKTNISTIQIRPFENMKQIISSNTGKYFCLRECDKNGSIMVYDLTKNESYLKIEITNKDNIASTSFSNDDNLLAVYSTGSIQIWDLMNKTLINRIKTRNTIADDMFTYRVHSGIHILSNKKYLVHVYGGYIGDVYDIFNGDLIQSFSDGNPMLFIEPLNNGRFAALSSGVDSSISLWEEVNNNGYPMIRGDIFVGNFSNDSKQALCSNGSDIYRIDLNSFEKNHISSINKIDFYTTISNNLQYLAYVYSDDSNNSKKIKIDLINSEKRQDYRTLEYNFKTGLDLFTQLYFSRDDSLLFIPTDSEIVIWDYNNNIIINNYNISDIYGGGPYGLLDERMSIISFSISPNNEIFAVVKHDKCKLKILNLSNREEIFNYNESEDEIIGAWYSNEGNALLLRTEKEFRKIDMNSRKIILNDEIPAFPYPFTSANSLISTSNLADKIAISSFDTIYLYGGFNGRKLIIKDSNLSRGIDKVISYLKMSNDGKKLYIVYKDFNSAEKTISELWNIEPILDRASNIFKKASTYDKLTNDRFSIDYKEMEKYFNTNNNRIDSNAPPPPPVAPPPSQDGRLQSQGR